MPAENDSLFGKLPYVNNNSKFSISKKRKVENK
jgi:hypothetical protein